MTDSISALDWLIAQIEKTTRAFALLSGIILLLLSLLTILSVFGRTINAYGLGPIQGDFELVENGTAFVVFCALPYCQLRFGHVCVDVLSQYFPKLLSYLISLISHCGMSVIAIIVTRQLYLGMMDKYQWGETSFILQWPVWWGYAAALVPSLLWAVSCIAATCLIATGRHDEREGS